MSVAVNKDKPPLVVIAGPTASGKSALAMALSRLTSATIINADASQVYSDLRVLTSRPSEAEEEEAPHRLFGYVDGAHACSAAQWAASARGEIADAHSEGLLPVLVGGTGLYIRTLLDGIAPVPEVEPAIRNAARTLPVAEAYEALRLEDAEAAARLSPADTTRVARALEVVRSSGKPLLAWQTERSGGIGDQVRTVPAILLPPREWLMMRCDTRFAAMVSRGALEEVRAMLARGLDPALPAMRAIGVRELSSHLRGDATLDESMEAGRLATRQYAKRQYTWFRNQMASDWVREDKALDIKGVIKLATKLRDMALT